MHLSFLCTYFYNDVPKAGDTFPQTELTNSELQVSLQKIILEICGLNLCMVLILLNN